jgi:class 3 adenylate cyclase
VRVRIGVHTGEAIREGGDLFGRSVIVASRITGTARGDEILASSLVVELADGNEFTFDEGRDVVLKGLSRAQRVHALKWDT